MKKLPCLMNARLTDHTKLMAEKLKQREPCLVRYTQNMFYIVHGVMIFENCDNMMFTANLQMSCFPSGVRKIGISEIQ